MTHIKNLKPTSTTQGFCPHKSLYNDLPELSQLCVLGSTIYMIIHKNKQELKSEKFVLKALKSKLVGFDKYTIYHIYIKKQ